MKLALAFLLISSVFATGKAKAPDYVAEAKQVVSNLAAGRFNAVEKTFTPQMAQALPTEKLKAFWTGLITNLGAFEGAGGSSVTEQTGYHTVVLACKFKKQEVGLALTFDDQQKLAGIHIVPAPAK